jgi:hypothetical protein
MKNIRQVCVAFVLTLVFTNFALAGNMSTPVADPPPPPSASSSLITEGQMQTGSSEAIDLVTETAISLLQSLLPLF